MVDLTGADAAGRTYVAFAWKEAAFRLCSSHLDAMRTEIIRQREILEGYIARHRDFLTSFVPVDLRPDAPPIARAMADAARLAGVGPMAAVAGCVAQFAAEAALRAGADEAIVENGGDLFLVARRPVTVGLYAGRTRLAAELAFLVEPHQTPLSICSSSSRMGHSVSLGDCDLATVVAADGALADAAATLACNSVRSVADIDGALAHVAAIPGVHGVLLAKGDRVGLVGNLPRLVRSRDPDHTRKITRHAASGSDPELPPDPAR